MKYYARFIIAVLCTCLSIHVFAQSTAVDQLNEKLQSFHSYYAKFLQVTFSNKTKLKNSTSGQVWLQRPGKFRWETYQPTHQILIANNKVLWIYDVDLQQVTKRNLGDQKHFSAAELLTGNADLISQHFFVKEEKGWYVLTPKSQTIALQQIKFKFSNNKLTDLQFTNNLGQTSLFKFSNIKVNSELDSNLFTFTPPKGVDVLNQDDSAQ